MIDQVQRIKEKLEKRLEEIVDLSGTRIERSQNIDVVSFEEEYLVTLPEGYRRFLLEIPSGWDGPGNGLLSLSMAVRYNRDRLPTDILTRPFFPSNDYNPDEDKYWIAMYEKCDAGKISDAEFDSLYRYVDSGTISVCDEGNGYVHRLVVTGPTRGRMWIDARGAGQGFIFLNVTFLDWYERWLDQVLHGLNGSWWLTN